MKILVIHQYYLMAGMPGGSRFNEFSRLWSEQGHEVTVLAGTVDYASGQTPEKYLGRWHTEEFDGKVRVLRCHVPRTYGKSYVGRMWAFAGFTLSALTAWALIEKPDVVIATSPPLVAALPGWAIARVRGVQIPWVFEIRDLWPESAITTGVLSKDSLLTRLLYALESFACRSAQRINVLTPAFRDDLVARHLAPLEKIVFVPNGADVDMFQPGPKENRIREKLNWKNKFVVMYAGAHGRANAVHQLLEAAEKLKAHPNILLVTVGDGPERAQVQAEAQKRGLENLIFYGPQPKEAMPDFVRACDVGAAVLQDNPTFRTVYPNKVFDYMACERPTLLAIDGVARKLVCDEAQAGLFVKPENAEDLAQGILKLAAAPELCRDMGQKGRAWVLQHATRDALAERYLHILQNLVAS